MKRLKNILVTVIPLVILFFIADYILLVPLNVKFEEGFNLFFGLAIIVCIAYFYEDVRYIFQDAVKGKPIHFPGKKVKGCVILLLLIYLGYQVSSLPLFLSQQYRNLIGDIETKEFEQEIPEMDLKKIPTVDEAYARRLGDKKLGEDVGLGSQVYVGDYTLISIKDSLYWVAPLEHIDIIKWFTNREGTPGYIMVSATDAQDVRLVQEDSKGNPINLKYLPSAYFNQDIRRKVYFEGNMFSGLTDYSFELDDSGRPYWVVTTYTKKVGIHGGSDATGVVVVDAQTGETNKYSVEDAPKWIDRIQPQSFVINQINDWGWYKNGFMNTLFAKKDIIQTTPGTNYMFIDGEWYFYTGMTSSGSDESTVGFMLSNTRTKETTFYKIAGATETAAMKSAEGKVQHLGYEASFPVLLNIENEPTYFTTLKDNQGLVKQYAFVNVKDYSKVGTGETLDEARTNYAKLVFGTQGSLLDSSLGEHKTIEATIERIGTSQTDGNTYYTILLKEHPELLLMGSGTISAELPISYEGDPVKIEYIDGKNKTKTIVTFDNLKFNQ
ncbi:MAG: hypothetical protein HFE53_08620 [Turicibacter sp.]|uniref:Cell shape-determining protein n=1 Tax=Turicibacter faecis TaxID=2963365 RepID=A0ABM8IKT8_9FIRM|nr:hypothetical protein [Turicibacter sp. TA25]MCI8702360.1 hypothetical protein [Turicibacter sp.]MCU7205387.1 hypothetical protein [Turicibacter sp. TA25]NCE79427.1 hypothetical protein [Turicibacter sp. TS3]BEH91875.1 hypothetical protein T23_19770 [Turicibacter sp. TC023]